MHIDQSVLGALPFLPATLDLYVLDGSRMDVGLALCCLLWNERKELLAVSKY